MMGKNIVWHQTSINQNERENLLKQKGILIWLTGLSGSGKSTVGSLLEERLHKNGKLTYLLDGDNIRHGVSSDLGFSGDDRRENIRRIKEIAKLFVDAGLITIGTFISPYEEDRESIRNLMGERFVEIYVKCDLATCENRDPKGLYQKARDGEIQNFTGIDAPYEEPKNPEVLIDTASLSVVEAVDKIIAYIERYHIWEEVK
ncbi:MAG: adenylyl-sulfate kinase [Acidaminobacteraceae bacterium]